MQLGSLIVPFRPKTLRYRLLHVAARLVHGGRRTRLKIERTWCWAHAVAVAALVEAAQVLGGDPGQADVLIDVTELEPDQEPLPGPVGQAVGAAAQESADAIRRVVFAAAVPGRVLLHPAADVIDGGEPEPGHVERIEQPGRGRAARCSGAVA